MYIVHITDTEAKATCEMRWYQNCDLISIISWKETRVAWNEKTCV